LTDAGRLADNFLKMGGDGSTFTPAQPSVSSKNLHVDSVTPSNAPHSTNTPSRGSVGK
jgi:hypothetical protein